MFSPQRDRGPDFVGIGAQKAGTTWLAKQLGQHPQVFVPLTKELHFVDWLNHGHPRSYRGRTNVSTWHGRFYRRSARRAVKAVRNRQSDWSGAARLLAYHFGPRSALAYRRVFPRASPNRLRGEFTPDYGPVHSSTVKTFLQMFPNVKILLVLRDPIERRWSNILHVLSAAGQDPASLTVDQLKSVLENDHIGDYRRIIETWRPHVSPDRFGLFFYDDLEVDAGQFLDQVLTFLDLSPGWRPEGIDERVYVTRHLRSMPDEIRRWAAAEQAPLLDWLVDSFPDVEHPERWRDQANAAYQ